MTMALFKKKTKERDDKYYYASQWQLMYQKLRTTASFS